MYNYYNMIESQIEQYALDILANLGWQILHGPDIGPDGAVAERELRRWYYLNDYTMLWRGSIRTFQNQP